MSKETRKDYQDLPFIRKGLKPRKNDQEQLETFCEMPHIDNLPGPECALMYDHTIKLGIEEREKISLTNEECLLMSPQDRRKRVSEQHWPNQMRIHLVLEYENDKKYGGSGIFIGPYHILTAGHNIYSKGKWANKIYAFPGLNPFSEPFGSAMATRCYVLSGWLEGEEEDDLGLIVLDQPLGLRTGWAGLIVLSDEEIMKKKLLIAGYPGDKGFKELWGMEGKVSQLEPKVIYYDLDTTKGQSGSGLSFIDQDNIYVVGVHVRKHVQNGNQFNQAIRITEDRYNVILQWMSESFAIEKDIPYISPNQEEIRDLFHQARRGQKKEFDLLEKEAKQGNARAIYYMSCLYNEGFGVESNLNTAIRWLKKSYRYNIQEYQKLLSIIEVNNSRGNIVSFLRRVFVDYTNIICAENKEDSVSRNRGISYCSNGNRYEGEFVDDKRHGKGILIFANGDEYKGDFVDNKRQGKGILIFANGSIYKGDFFGDKYHGEGILLYAYGDKYKVYKGDYVGSKRQGKGILIFANGDEYKGDFFDDKCHGKGIYIFANGKKYEGDFIDGKIHGKGILFFANGNKYEGDLVDNRSQGKGIYIFANGKKYEGDFIDDKWHGKGTYYFTNGAKYEGDFFNGKRHGKGTYYFTDGAKYEGDFIDGKIHGKGILFFANGNKYEGDFVDNKHHGQGIYTSANGNKYEGYFVGGEYQGKETV